MIRLELAGEHGLILYLPAQMSSQNLLHLQQLQHQIQQLLSGQLLQLLPSYASLLIVLQPHHQDLLAIKTWLEQQLVLSTELPEQVGKSLVLPVYYHKAWDLERVAHHAGLSVEQVMDLHQATEYSVYAIGFAPGFAYLGELDAQLLVPRLNTPRTKVPQGAVAIAERQTAVYPAASPGGWNILGLCPTPLFQRQKLSSTEQLMPFAVGDKVRFEAINQARFLALGGVLPQELR